MDRVCPACNRDELQRSTRRGLLERYFFSVLGLFPWRCRRCRKRVLLRDRGEILHKTRAHRVAHAA